MRVAIAFTTKDRTDLSKRSIEPLLKAGVDVWWFDGSRTEAGQHLLADYPATKKFASVIGGPEIANVMALTCMLEADYDYVGICESDVLLADGWFEPTMELFARGTEAGLTVGAVSPRAYEDRVLIQCDGFAVMHNLGAGCVIYSREAARRVLALHRTPWTAENRIVFAQLSGLDIGRYWAFRASENFLTADWGWDRQLAFTGLCSLALTPSPVEMIGQIMPLAEQGLKLVTEPVEGLRDDRRFALFRDRLMAVFTTGLVLQRGGALLKDPGGSTTFFAHQLGMLGAEFTGEWRHQWSQAFGPHAWRAEGPASARVPVFGAVEFLLSGGEKGAKVQAIDTGSGYEIAPELPPADGQRIAQIVVPGLYSQRDVVLNVEAGAVFYGIRTDWPQLIDTGFRFDFSVLPPV